VTAKAILRHGVSAVAALLFGIVGLGALISSLIEIFPLRSTESDNPIGLAPFIGLLWTYAAAAVLRLWSGRPFGWHPGWTQGLAVTWFGAWTILELGYLARSLVYGGPEAFGDRLGFSVMVWALLVGGPLLGGFAFHRFASRHRDRAVG
jgi:hypothetical protein